MGFPWTKIFPEMQAELQTQAGRHRPGVTPAYFITAW